ncbi:MAG: hypothetical protein PHP79_01660 [Clostridia bacterium]|nr:hypothetical protein [Clostridia bacterium]MDD4679588.1 hypothetical protein [Clostridia bacterium]
MEDSDFNKLQRVDLSKITADLRNPAQNMIDKMNRDSKESMRALNATHRERDAEELRRHNELVDALKEAGEKGATIIVGDNANGIQIQQNSTGASQTMENTQGLDYEKTMSVLKEISSYFEYPQFQQTYGVNAENVKQMVAETMTAIENKEDEGLIKKSLHLLKDITVGAASSLIASGILAILGTLPG